MEIPDLEKNSSKEFYEKIGGIKIADKVYQFGEKALKGLVYSWSDLKAFVEIQNDSII